MIPARHFLHGQRLASISKSRWRAYTTNSAQKPKSAHSLFYSDTLPAMIPVFLLGSAVYLGLQLTQVTLSHEKHLDEATQRVKELEDEIDALQNQRAEQNAISPVAVSDSAQPSRRGWW
ncbi:hypothetical protein BDQ12DRAFT_674838 [Crucibulum laeve]|uniref:Uncharacterized protein n=1 Tax=Crucibulum laeve TaxID=68775 RepID=A0A5C3MHD9_9AGAR|nr:hypothetical protein BDQ12DRAFT_674838 [Crucibulum laeve]